MFASSRLFTPTMYQLSPTLIGVFVTSPLLHRVDRILERLARRGRRAFAERRAENEVLLSPSTFRPLAVAAAASARRLPHRRRSAFAISSTWARAFSSFTTSTIWAFTSSNSASRGSFLIDQHRDRKTVLDRRFFADVADDSRAGAMPSSNCGEMPMFGTSSPGLT